MTSRLNMSVLSLLFYFDVLHNSISQPLSSNQRRHYSGQLGAAVDVWDSCRHICPSASPWWLPLLPLWWSPLHTPLHCVDGICAYIQRLASDSVAKFRLLDGKARLTVKNTHPKNKTTSTWQFWHFQITDQVTQAYLLKVYMQRWLKNWLYPLFQNVNNNYYPESGRFQTASSPEMVFIVVAGTYLLIILTRRPAS